MTATMRLADFSRPPLNEIALGVQFNPVPEYSQVYSGEVWALYKRAYPRVEEQPPLAPQFETFGRPRAAQVKLQVQNGPQHDRFWFLSKDGEELIQFQQDRLHHNWRVLDGSDKPYPHFPAVIRRFSTELQKLVKFFGTISSTPLEITQCEVSYFNRIISSDGAMPRADEWLRFLKFNDHAPDDYSGRFRETIRSSKGDPIGRLHCEIRTAYTSADQPMINFTLTARGAPAEPSVVSAIEFLNYGHDIIIRRFVELTTDSAHQAWGRTR